MMLSQQTVDFNCRFERNAAELLEESHRPVNEMVPTRQQVEVSTRCPRQTPFFETVLSGGGLCCLLRAINQWLRNKPD